MNKTHTNFKTTNMPVITEVSSKEMKRDNPIQ